MRFAGGARLSLLVLIVSAVMLGFELLFPQVLIFLPDRKAVTTIIGIAMLGLGAGGILLYFFAESPAADGLARVSLSGLGLSIPLSFVVAVWLPWYPLVVIASAVPFTCASLFLSLAFVRAGSARIYFLNLIGSGLGALLVFRLEPWLGEESCLILLAAISLAAAGFIPKYTSAAGRLAARALSLAALCVFVFNTASGGIDLIRVIPPSRVPPERESDALSFGFRVLEEPGVRHLASERNMIARVDAVLAPDYDVSYRFFEKGLDDLTDPISRREYEEYLSSPIKLYFNDHLWSLVAKESSLLAELPPYNVLEEPSVLIIGPGGGVDIAKAVYNRSRRIIAVEINPGVVRMMQGPLKEASGDVYGRAEIKVMDGRTYLRLSDEKFDLIHLAFADLYVPFIHSDIFMENYLYTLEAFDEYFRHLTHGGMIAVHKYVRGASWNRDLFRIASTAVKMLRRQGLEPAEHIFFAGNEGRPDEYYGYILVKRAPFTRAEVQNMERGVKAPFRVFHSPSGSYTQNPFSRIILAPDLDLYLSGQEFDISPSTDDKPFFYLFDRSRSLVRAFFGLFLATIFVFIFIPLFIIIARDRLIMKPGFHAFSIFFALIAVAYMFLQITMIQRFNLFLGSPLHAMGAVITSFLVFAGLGSELSGRLKTSWQRLAVFCVPAIVILYAYALDDILEVLISPSLGARLLVAVALLAPLSLALGFPFPQGLARAKSRWGPRSAAIMFAVNGSFSALGVALFSLLAPDAGIRAIFYTAGFLYLVAAALFLIFSRRT